MAERRIVVELEPQADGIDVEELLGHSELERALDLIETLRRIKDAVECPLYLIIFDRIELEAA